MPDRTKRLSVNLMNKLGKQKKNERGFKLIEFKDRYGLKCSMQQSSLATGPGAIWLGVDDVEPKIMASQAREFKVMTQETCGWVPYPIPKEVLLCSRMHLERPQVQALIKHLQNWVDTDSFSNE